jgi:hypothetical protein
LADVSGSNRKLLEQEVEARVLAHSGERPKGQIQALGKKKKG